ncbi:MAG: hypothetical protein ACEQSR_05475 [Candidatus Methylacidiphilales bacterium]
MKNEFENIDDGFLKNLNAKEGFNTPDGYFEKSKESILAKTTTEPNLNLDKMEGGFTIPTNYFEENKAAILSKTNKPQALKIALFNWKYLTGIAALFVAVLGIIIFINNQNSTNLSANLNKVSNEEMIDYLANNDVRVEWINELKPITQVEQNGHNNTNEMEQYLMDHADEQALLDEL